MADGWTLDEAKAPAPAKGGGGFSLEEARGMGGNTQPTAPAPKSIWQRIGDAIPSAEEAGTALERGVGTVVRGAGDALGLFANPLNAGINATGIPRALTGRDLSTNLGETLRDSTGLAKPRNATERVIDDIGSGAAAGLFTAGGAAAGQAATAAPGLARSFLSFLAEAPVVNTVAGATGAGSSGVAREAGYGPGVQMAAGLAGGLGGGIAAARFSRPRLTAAPEPLIEGSLDGGPIPDIAPFDIDAALGRAGASPDQFSSPEVAARMAERAQAAQQRAPQNGLGPDELARQQALRDAIGLGETDPGFAPQTVQRTIPDEVPIIAAPEGNVRADDAGGIAGVNRKRAADSAVMGEAQGLVDRDPLIAHILDSNIAPQAKMATIWDRLQALRDQPEQQFDPVDTSIPEQPWQAPTAERAATPRGNATRSRIHEITAATESGNREFAADGSRITSSAGAKGSMQVMGKTGRDPGYGVRPSDGSVADDARLGRDYIDALTRHYGNDPAKAWAAYNAGPGALDGAVRKYGDDWLSHMPAETRAYVNKNMKALGGAAPEPVLRAPAPRDEPLRTDPGFERQDAPRSPTNTEMESGAVFQDRNGIFSEEPGRGRVQYDSPTRTGGSDETFRATTDDPAGQPGRWEDDAQRMQDDLAERMRKTAEETAASAGARMEGERTTGAADPSAEYRGKYAQRPSPVDGGGYAVNEGGYVAGKDGNPVAFRSAKEAATFAAKNKMGGDFELGVWQANSKRVVLRRKEGSDYGRTPETGPQPAQGPSFDATTPKAGRSPDRSQRLIDGPRANGQEDAALTAAPTQRVNNVEPAGTGQTRTGGVEAPVPNAPRTKAPEDALTFIARNGGIADTEGHALRARSRGQGGGGRDLPQFAPGGGHVFKAGGKSIDQVGEMLHEAGFIQGERPTTAQTLDYIERAAGEKQYRPNDAVDAAERTRTAAQDDETARVRGDLEDAARKTGEPLGDYEARRAMRDQAERGGDPEDALRRTREAEQADRQNPGTDLYSRGVREGLGADRPANRPLADDLGRIADEHSSPVVQQLARRLQGLVGDARLQTGESLGENVRGVARMDAEGNVSAAVAHAGDTQAVLHEAIHVATLSRYGELVAGAADGTNASRAVRSLDDLLARAQKSFGDHIDDPTGEIAHALSSTDELLAGGLTSPTVQRFLEGQKDGNLWQRFVDGVRQVLGLEPRYTTMLDGILKHGADLLDNMRRDDPFAGNGKVTIQNLDGEGGAALQSWRKVADLAVDLDGLKGDAEAATRAIKNTMGSPVDALKAAGGRLQRFGSSTVYSADGSLRAMAGHFNAPTLTKVADMFHARAGAADGTGRTYFEAVDRSMRTYTQRAYDAIEPLLKDKVAMDRVRSLLATPKASVAATATERAAATKIRDVLKEVLAYRREAGEDLGEVTDGYFPRVLDANRVVKDSARFQKIAEGLYRGVGMTAKEAGDAAAAWSQRILDTHAGLDGGLEFVRSSSTPSSGKAREFGKAADAALRDFYETDPFATLAGYISGSVRKAEQARRFGPEGAVGSPARAAWEKAHGTMSQRDVMIEAARDEIRASGKEAVGSVERVGKIIDSNLGKIAPSGRFAKTVLTNLHTWNQLSVMDRVTISSLGDLAMGFVRGGPKYGFGHLAESIHQFGRQVAKLPPNEAARYAEAVGTANDAFASAVQIARVDAGYAGAGAHNLVDKFYRGVGLQQLTDGGRIAATKTGMRFVDDLAHDLVSTNARTRTRAAGYLRELGVKDPDAFGSQLRQARPTPEAVMGDASGFNADYGTAIMRYVNQSILMPTRGQKPTWANHPIGSLFFSLQGYSYGFKKNVIERVGRETAAAVRERDPAKLAAASGLSVLAGLTYLNDTYLRPALFGSNYKFDEETPTGTALRVADRVGVLGPLSPVVNAFNGIKYKRSLAGSASGPIVGRSLDALTAGAGLWIDNKEGTNTNERKAAEALYDVAIEPAADAFAAGRLKGPFRTGAIFATGNRTDKGMLPSDREAFVSRVAGGKEQ